MTKLGSDNKPLPKVINVVWIFISIILISPVDTKNALSNINLF